MKRQAARSFRRWFRGNEGGTWGPSVLKPPTDLSLFYFPVTPSPSAFGSRPSALHPRLPQTNPRHSHHALATLALDARPSAFDCLLYVTQVTASVDLYRLKTGVLRLTNRKSKIENQNSLNLFPQSRSVTPYIVKAHAEDFFNFFTSCDLKHSLCDPYTL
jgi:hypothetical protein